MKKVMYRNEGFTLIEMMVVIAVVGILSAAVLAGLGGSRDKARDARVISGLNQIRVIAESNYQPTSNTPYSQIDPTGGNIAASVKADIDKQLSGGASASIVVSGYTYKAYATLPSGAGTFCVDSAGSAGTEALPGSPCSGTASGVFVPTGAPQGDQGDACTTGADCASGSCKDFGTFGTLCE